MSTIENVRRRLRAEFLEMPGMLLKSLQVQRLCGIDEGVCQAALDDLVMSNFLCMRPDGHYALVTDEKIYRRRAVTATLRTPRYLVKAS